jgi:hypothetical protein
MFDCWLRLHRVFQLICSTLSRSHWPELMGMWPSSLRLTADQYLESGRDCLSIELFDLFLMAQELSVDQLCGGH